MSNTGPITTGLPLVAASCSCHTRSSSRCSRSRSSARGAIVNRPGPGPAPSAWATASSSPSSHTWPGSAVLPGPMLPTTWSVEKPSAPSRSPSATSSCIAAISSASRHACVRGFGAHHCRAHREMTDEERPVQRGLDASRAIRRSSPGRSSRTAPPRRWRRAGPARRSRAPRSRTRVAPAVSAGERVSAVRDHDGRHAVARARREERIPELIRVEMGVRVDPARREHQAAPVELLGAGSARRRRRSRSGRRRPRRRPRSRARPVPSTTVAPRTTRSCVVTCRTRPGRSCPR